LNRLRLGVSSRRAAYVALVLLTLVWGFNWVVMKAALARADPLSFNFARTWLAVLVLFAALALRRGRWLPHSWWAVVVTGFFQTTINFGATMMAVATGGAGRAAVLVFTMPFWTLVIARIVLDERIRRFQVPAIALAFTGLVCIVEPWSWQGGLAAKLWAVLSGFGWAAGTVALKRFQRDPGFDILPFIAWQMAVGAIPLALLPWLYGAPAIEWTAGELACLLYVGAISSAAGFIAWMEILRWLPAGEASLNIFAIPVIALVASMVIFGEKLAGNEWLGIALIGAGLAMVALWSLGATRRVIRE
jgi:drug/metabolite transporter (DMT)-like permease